MANGWTDQRRARQAAIIRRWMPWLRSTGPKTAAGKQAVAQNAVKHGARSQRFRDERRALRKFLTACCEGRQEIK